MALIVPLYITQPLCSRRGCVRFKLKVCCLDTLIRGHSAIRPSGNRQLDRWNDSVFYGRISGPDRGPGSRAKLFCAPLRPVPLFDPFIQHLARCSELLFIATPSLGPLVVDLLLCFQEAWRLLDAGVSSRIQNCWLELKTQSVQDSPQRGFGVDHK